MKTPQENADKNYERRARILHLISHLTSSREHGEGWHRVSGRITQLVGLMTEEYAPWSESKLSERDRLPTRAVIGPLIVYLFMGSRKRSVSPLAFGKETEKRFVDELTRQIGDPDARQFVQAGMRCYRRFIESFNARLH